MFWGRVGAGCGVRDLLCDINSVLPEAKQAPSPGFREELTPPCSPAWAAPRLRQASGRAGRVRDRRALGLPRTSATRMPAAGVLPPCPPPRRARGHLQPRGNGHGRLCCLCVAAPRPGSSLPPRDAGAASRGAAPAWGGGEGALRTDTPAPPASQGAAELVPHSSSEGLQCASPPGAPEATGSLPHPVAGLPSLPVSVSMLWTGLCSLHPNPCAQTLPPA